MQPQHDNPPDPTYDAIMGGAKAFITVKLQTKNPIELGAFVSEFTSVASQYEKFIKENYPDFTSEAHIFVKEVRRGSMIIELLPFLPIIMGTDAVTSTIDQINDFVKHHGGKIRSYVRGKSDDEDTRSDLKDFGDTVKAIANDRDGKATIESAVFEDGKRKVRAAFSFTTKEANRALTHIEERQRGLEKTSHADYERILMVFKQANVKGTPVGKRTGEWVEIERISDKELPLIYASELAEQRIKHEINDADENVFHKGFVVDVNVETKGGRPVAYRVTNFHQVIDLPPPPRGALPSS
jgi:hypothetical protein